MIEFEVNRIPDVLSIVRLYENAGLVRPITDIERIMMMYSNSNLVVTAWDREELIGVARSVTDFSYCCYLSDLAVWKSYQGRGIGRKLIELTREQAGDGSMLLLLSASGAMTYYPKIGMDKVENGFIYMRKT